MYISKENFKRNNINFLQFFMSLLVIYSHAFSIGSDTIVGEVIKQLTSERFSTGRLAVATLFIISGFLVCASYENTNFIQYLKNRIFRLFPGLILVVAAAVFVLGPCVSTLSTSEYFKHSATWSYLKNIKLYPMHWNLPGVFAQNAYPNSVNGSLWTLPYQFALYILLGLFGAFGLLRHKNASLFCFAALAYAHIQGIGGGALEGILSKFGLNWSALVYLGMYFTAGMTAYMYRDSLRLSKTGAMTCLLLLLFSWFIAGEFQLSISIFGTYLILYFAYCTKPLHSPLFGLSFGVYIYGFPIQQTLTFLFGGAMNPWLNMVIAIPITILCAWLSNRFVEQPVANLKKYLTLEKYIPEKVRTYWDNLYAKWLMLVDRFFAMPWLLYSFLVIGAVSLWCIKNL